MEGVKAMAAISASQWKAIIAFRDRNNTKKSSEEQQAEVQEVISKPLTADQIANLQKLGQELDRKFCGKKTFLQNELNIKSKFIF